MIKSKLLVYGILVVAVTGIIFISGCAEKECKINDDCLIKNCFTVECKDNNCIYSLVSDCCGNDICEVTEDYKSCPEDGCLIPMVFEGVGHIGHGMLLDSGEIEFKEVDLKHNGGFYMANIDLPMKFQTKTKDVTLHLQCVNKETRLLLFSSIEDKITCYELPGYHGSAQISGKDVVFNTGQMMGTKIIEANRGESAVFTIQFSFTREESSISLECEASILAKEPAQSIQIPLIVKYIKS